MAVQAIKKKEFGGVKKSIADLKKEEGFSTRDNLNMSMSNADKKMSWLVMPKAFEKALRIPGFPVGYLSIICGHSNTGKSTLVNCIIAAAQKQVRRVIFIISKKKDFEEKKRRERGVPVDAPRSRVSPQAQNVCL